MSIEVSELYDSTIPNAYLLFGSISAITVGSNFLTFELFWDPPRGVVNRYGLILAPSDQGKGHGPKINQITEELAKSLGVKKLVISVITNQEWKENLLKNGFEELPHGTVYKTV